MFKFFDSLWNFLTMVWDFVEMLIENLITFMELLVKTPGTIVAITSQTPYIISFAVTSVFTVAMVKVIINRQEAL